MVCFVVSKRSEEVSLLAGTLSEHEEKVNMVLAKHARALENMVRPLPMAAGSLSEIHNLAACALQSDPARRSLGTAFIKKA